jgi:hypothetical protein
MMTPQNLDRPTWLVLLGAVSTARYDNITDRATSSLSDSQPAVSPRFLQCGPCNSPIAPPPPRPKPTLSALSCTIASQGETRSFQGTRLPSQQRPNGPNPFFGLTDSVEASIVHFTVQNQTHRNSVSR